MRRWSYVLGGFAAWTVHFSGLYAIASLDAQTPARDRALWLGVAAGLTLACGGACLALAALAGRRLTRRREAGMALLDQLALLAAALSLIAIAWQAAAVLIA